MSDSETPEEARRRQVEARRLADTMRRVIDRLVNTRAPADGLAAAADRLEALVEWLEPFPQGALYEGFSEVAVSGDPSAVFDHSPMMGRANPLAPPLLLEVDGTDVTGRAVFGLAYEGPPGCVHGGIVAAAFDDVLGLANTLSRQPGFTGTLTVRYRKPTPLGREIRFAARIVRTEGRKNFVVGESTVDGVVTAEAEGIFVAIDPQKFLNLKASREERFGDRVDDRFVADDGNNG